MITIVQSGDLTLTVVENDVTTMTAAKEKSPPVVRKTAVFNVSRETLSKSSPVFDRMLNSPNFKGASSSTVQLEGDRVKSMEVWFRATHGSTDMDYTVPLEEMWYIVAAGDKYDFDIKELGK